MGFDNASLNPYSPPKEVGPPPPVQRSESTKRLLRKFRTEIMALGAGWMLISVLPSVALVGMANDLTGRNYFTIAFSRGIVSLANPVIGIVSLMVVLFFVGLFTCLKNIAAVHFGLWLSYIAFAASVLLLNPCLGLFVLLIILQARRVIGWAKELQQAGVPLNCKPEQLSPFA